MSTYLESLDISTAKAKLEKAVNPKIIDFQTQFPTSVDINAEGVIDLLNESLQTMKTAVEENKDSVDMVWDICCSRIAELEKDEVFAFINEARGEDIILSLDFCRFLVSKYLHFTTLYLAGKIHITECE